MLTLGALLGEYTRNGTTINCPILSCDHFPAVSTSLAYQEYCTIISFFSACYVIHFSCLVFCVTMETGGAPKPWEDGWTGSLRKLSLLAREAWGRNLAVNGRRELRGQIWLCVQNFLGSTGPADAAFRMSCLQKPIFPRSQCSLGFHRNQA